METENTKQTDRKKSGINLHYLIFLKATHSEVKEKTRVHELSNRTLQKGTCRK